MSPLMDLNTEEQLTSLGMGWGRGGHLPFSGLTTSFFIYRNLYLAFISGWGSTGTFLSLILTLNSHVYQNFEHTSFK